MLKQSLRKKLILSLASAFALSQFFNFSSFANLEKSHLAKAATTTYSWNNTIPEKTPAAGTGNCKLVLLGNSHGETAGAADWVSDGGFSDFADVFVMAEANRPLTQSEYLALKQFVDSGKGYHYNADRNMNTWDSTEVYNGYNRSIAAQYNLSGVYGIIFL